MLLCPLFNGEGCSEPCTRPMGRAGGASSVTVFLATAGIAHSRWEACHQNLLPCECSSQPWGVCCFSGSSNPVLPTFTILIAASSHLKKAQPPDWLSHASALSADKLHQPPEIAYPPKARDSKYRSLIHSGNSPNAA